MAKRMGSLTGLMALMWSLAACDNYSFNLAPVSNEFSQSVSVNNKVDIIWVVDGSGTMANHQENLAQNFAGFIDQFRELGFDFHMVVASTDAWVRELNYNAASCFLFYDPTHPMYSPGGPNPSQNPNASYVSSADCQETQASWSELASFRDGDIYGGVGSAGVRSGVHLITSDMGATEAAEIFRINVTTGVRGDGVREATLQSLRGVLRRNHDGSPAYNGETHTVLDRFRRPDAFLAVIVISDEEDQSRQQQGDAAYESIEAYTQDFLGFLDGYTGAMSPSDRRYSVSGIILEDLNSCPYELHNQVSEGQKYMAVAQATRGVVGNICSSQFYVDLQNIAQKVISLATRFKLSSAPNVDTIRVVVDGKNVPQDPENGWSYVSENGGHYVEFHGSSVPSETSKIAVNFSPSTLR